MNPRAKDKSAPTWFPRFGNVKDAEGSRFQSRIDISRGWTSSAKSIISKFLYDFQGSYSTALCLCKYASLMMKNLSGKSDSAATSFKCVFLMILHIQPYIYALTVKVKLVVVVLSTTIKRKVVRQNSTFSASSSAHEARRHLHSYNQRCKKLLSTKQLT